MSEKKFPPSAKKLRDARRKGHIPKSDQLTSTAAFASSLVVLGVAFPFCLEQLGQLMEGAYALMAEERHQQAWIAFCGRAAGVLLWLMAPFVCAAVAGVLIAGVLQSRGLLSFEPLGLKFEKLNPASNLKQIFSLKKLLDLCKKLVETLLLSLIVGGVIWKCAPDLLLAVRLSPASIAQVGAKVGLWLFIACTLFWVAVSAVDYGIQRFTFMREQRMTHDEVKREHKDADGDPHIKSKRRAEHRELLNEGERKLRSAKALVVNPTHVAVAIAHEAQDVPRVLAKALDDEALAMRRMARRLGIPIVQDVGLARALYARVPVDHCIGEEFYVPVARTLHHVEALRKGQGPSSPTRV